MGGLQVQPLRVVSTIPAWGFELYGDKWLMAMDNWPETVEFIVYSEGFDIRHPRITGRRVEDLPKLEAFKKRYVHYRPVLWQWDIVRWSNKVFSAFDGLYAHDGIGLWLDADAVAYRPITEEWLRGFLPKHAYMSLFRRAGMEPETGFWLVDCQHKEHKSVFELWLRWLESGSFKTLQQWCDASTLNATLRAFEKEERISVVNLSGKHEQDMHPLSKHEIGRYINHLKGALKFSSNEPEQVAA